MISYTWSLIRFMFYPFMLFWQLFQDNFYIVEFAICFVAQFM